MSNLSRWYQLLNESFLDLGRQFEVGARVLYDGRTGGAGQVEDLLTAGAEQGAGREYPAEGIAGADRVDNRYWVETFFERGFCIVQLGSFGAVGDGKAVEVEALDKGGGLINAGHLPHLLPLLVVELDDGRRLQPEQHGLGCVGIFAQINVEEAVPRLPG